MATSIGARPSFQYVIEKPDSGLVTTVSRSPTNCTPRVTTRLTRLCCRRCPKRMTCLSDNLLFDLGLVSLVGHSLAISGCHHNNLAIVIAIPRGTQPD